MLADPLREALCEHHESAVIDTPLQRDLDAGLSFF
jgi:hypothetical protein